MGCTLKKTEGQIVLGDVIIGSKRLKWKMEVTELHLIRRFIQGM